MVDRRFNIKTAELWRQSSFVECIIDNILLYSSESTKEDPWISLQYLISKQTTLDSGIIDYFLRSNHKEENLYNNQTELEVILVLLDNGLVPTENNLFKAIRYKYYDIAKYLIDQGVGITQEMFKAAVRNGYVEFVEYLTEKGLEINEDSLTDAITSRNLDMVKYVISRGAIPNQQSLSYSIEYSSVDIVKYLVELGLQPTEEDVRNTLLRPISAICEYIVSLVKPDPDIIKLLIKEHRFQAIDYLLSIGYTLSKDLFKEKAFLRVTLYQIGRICH